MYNFSLYGVLWADLNLRISWDDYTIVSVPHMYVSGWFSDTQNAPMAGVESLNLIYLF